MTNARIYLQNQGVAVDPRAGLHFSDGTDSLPWHNGTTGKKGVSKAYINRCIKAVARVTGMTYLEAAAKHRAAQELWLTTARKETKNDTFKVRKATRPLHEAHIALVDELIAEHS